MKLPHPSPPNSPSVAMPWRTGIPPALDARVDDPAVQPSSAPLRVNRDAVRARPASSSLNALSEEQLSKLTRVNTRKNVGGRASRFRSQMERVCRRLDNMAVEARLQQRQALQALPVVQPERAAAVDSLVVRGSSPSTKADNFDEDLGSDECSIIEPASEDFFEGEQCSPSVASAPARWSASRSERSSALSGASSSVRSALSTGGSSSVSRPERSVRISTSVTVLDYEGVKEPASISTLERFDHPTRTDRTLLQRKQAADETAFRRARVARGIRSDENGGAWAEDARLRTPRSGMNSSPKNSIKAKLELSGEYSRAKLGAPKESPVSRLPGQGDGSPVFSSPVSLASPRAGEGKGFRSPKGTRSLPEFVVPSPGGAYGPRQLP